MSKKNKKNKKNDIKKGVDSYVSSTEIKLLERLTESNHKYLREISTMFIYEYAMIKCKHQNDFQMILDFVKRVKRFVTEFKQNLIPSPGIQLFFTAMELELMLTKYYEVPSKFRELCLKHQSTEKDYNTFLNELAESVKIELDYEVAFSQKYLKRVKSAVDYLGSAVYRIYKYNEFCFDQENLEQELESKFEAFRQIVDEKIEFTRNECDTEIYKVALTRLEVIEKLAPDSFADYKKTLPEEADGDIRYMKSAVTRIKNLMEELKNLIEKGVVA